MKQRWSIIYTKADLRDHLISDINGQTEERTLDVQKLSTSYVLLVLLESHF